MPDEILIRKVTLADVGIIARHRAAMFLDMGSTTPAVVERLTSDTEAYLRQAIPSGEYVGWLASLASRPADPVAGAGVQVRRVLPFPRLWPDGRADVAHGPQALVLNVYTEPGLRRRGLARRLMQEVLEWAKAARIESLVLHAAPDGRALYEQLGFSATNEMRFMGDLTSPGGSQMETR
jgi:GNAT superfamily N-acetyltransferase